MRQLTSLDAQFLAIENKSHYGHVGGLAVFDPAARPGGRLTLDDVTELVRSRLHLLPPLRWKLAEVPLGLDRPYWVDDPHFELEFHVRETAVPPPGEDGKLAEQVARIFSRPLDRARPLWELYLIQGLPDGRVGMLTKLHHAAIDGMSGAEIMGVLFDLAPEGRELPRPEPGELGGEREPSQLELLARGVAGIPLQPLRAARSLPHTLAHLDVAPSIFGVAGAETISRLTSRARNALTREADGEVLERPKLKAPRVLFSGRISPYRSFAFGTLPLADVKRAKSAYGVKVNDVVVALCSAAVRGWLAERGELPEEPLLAQIPVSVRTTEQFGTYGNKVSVMFVPIATHVDDPEERLRLIHEELVAAKDRHKALPAEVLQDFANFIPPAINARAARVALQLGAQRRFRPLYNMVISNVPGPPFPLYLAGAELEANYPVSVITDGAGLNITVMSYRDRVDIGIVADREQMGDVSPLVDGMRDALDELLEHVG